MPVSKSRFDLGDPIVVIRILCGLLFIPHIWFKLNGMDAAAAFFAKAGFSPAMPVVVLALIAETIAAIGLVFGILTKWTGLLSAAVLAGAIQAVLATKGLLWLWNLGGIEYNLFWCVLSLILAANAWREEHRQFGRNFLLFPSRA